MTGEQVARDLCGMITDVPVFFTFGGTEYQGTRGQLINSKSVVEGGLFERPALSITTCRKKLNMFGNLVDRFGSEPQLQQVITDVRRPDQAAGSGGAYRIVRVSEDEFGMGVQWDLESVNK